MKDAQSTLIRPGVNKGLSTFIFMLPSEYLVNMELFQNIPIMFEPSYNKIKALKLLHNHGLVNSRLRYLNTNKYSNPG